MKSTLTLLATLALSTSAFAQQYNTVPASEAAQYRQCIAYANKTYNGGTDPSPIKGQNKAQAWCTCLWNETADDFKGNLATFAETARGKKINKTCEKYSDWSD